MIGNPPRVLYGHMKPSSGMRCDVCPDGILVKRIPTRRAPENTGFLLIRRADNHLFQSPWKRIVRFFDLRLGTLAEILRSRPFLSGKRVHQHAGKGQQAQQGNHNDQRRARSIVAWRLSLVDIVFMIFSSRLTGLGALSLID